MPGRLALGTDGAASGGSLDMWKEMRAAQMLLKLKNPRAMPASVTPGMVTVNGARALGINAGMLKVDVRTTIVDGKVFMEDHVVVGPDEERILEDGKRSYLISGHTFPNFKMIPPIFRT